MGELNDDVSRNEPAQQPPRGRHDFTMFPAVSPEEGTMYRVKKAKNGAWFFASRPDPQDGSGGRFDLPAPRGTCYWADDPGSAVKEMIGPTLARRGWVPPRLFHSRDIAMAPRPTGEHLADLEHPDANTVYGVLGELLTAHDYTVPQQWAEAFDNASLTGIRYRTRFAGPGRPNAYAFFDTAGPDETRPVDKSALSATSAVHRLGITVLDDIRDATAGQFEVTEPPER